MMGNKTESYLFELIKEDPRAILQGFYFDLNTGEERKISKERLIDCVNNILKKEHIVEDFYNGLPETIHLHWDYDDEDISTGKLLVLHIKNNNVLCY